MEYFKKKLLQSYKIILVAIICVPIGMLVGSIDAIFGKILIKITDVRTMYPYYFIVFLPVVGIIISYSYIKFGGKSAKGMNLVFEVGHGDEEVIPLRLIPFVILGTWLTHLFGGSAGREGVAVQIGATVSNFIGRKLNIKDTSQLFLIAGISAGFSGLFQTPIAAILFALEVLVVGELKYKALLPAITASISACLTSHFWGLEKFSFALNEQFILNKINFIKLIVIGIVFGVVGGLFAVALKKLKSFFAGKISNPILRIGVVGIVLSILFLLLYQGRYSGLGTNLISDSLNLHTIYSWDWILKFALTVLTLSVGFQGGEVTPLFAIGASLGIVLSNILGLPIQLSAALGYAAVFGAATNTLFAPVLIGAEVFGFEYVQYFGIVCSIAYIASMNNSIYSLQKIKR